MAEIWFRNVDETRDTPVSDQHPLPVQAMNDRESAIPSRALLHVTNYVQVPYGATSGAHDANDALGDRIAFTDVPVKGIIRQINMQDPDDDTLAATIHIFNAAFTAAASDAAYTVSDDDGLTQVAAELFDAGTDEGAYKFHQIKNVDAYYEALDGVLYAQLSTTGTPNIASAAVMPRVRLFITPLV